MFRISLTTFMASILMLDADPVSAQVTRPPITRTEQPPTTNDFLDIERSLTECISSNPPPGCGRTPTSPGDRGGWQQFVLFGVLLSGLTLIFGRIASSVRRRESTHGRT